MKEIVISLKRSTHKRLTLIKLDLNLRTLSKTISFLLNNYKEGLNYAKKQVKNYENINEDQKNLPLFF